MTPERRAEIEQHVWGRTDEADDGIVDELLAEIDRLTATLQFIEAWQLPRVWSEKDHRSHTYAYEYGSNGERDYMRNVAAWALRDETPYYLPPGVTIEETGK